MLIAESTVPVTLSGSGCTVIAGSWTSPYDGAVWTDPSDVDIDHMVAVTDNVNASKGHRGPEEWEPPLSSYWCRYATDWIEVKVRWKLSVTQTEYDALDQMLATC